MKLKKLVIAAVMAVSAASAFAASYYLEIHYFSDSTYTTMVGAKITHCGGQGTQTDGTVTSYSRVYQRYSCNGPIP